MARRKTSTASTVDLGAVMSGGVPTLEELRIRPEILEAAEALIGFSDGPGVEPSTIELAVRMIVHAYLSSDCV
jgi:hypothetical protein